MSTLPLSSLEHPASFAHLTYFLCLYFYSKRSQRNKSKHGIRKSRPSKISGLGRPSTPPPEHDASVPPPHEDIDPLPVADADSPDSISIPAESVTDSVPFPSVPAPATIAPPPPSGEDQEANSRDRAFLTAPLTLVSLKPPPSDGHALAPHEPSIEDRISPIRKKHRHHIFPSMRQLSLKSPQPPHERQPSPPKMGKPKIPFSPLRRRKDRENNLLNMEFRLEDLTVKLEQLESALTEKTEDLARHRFDSLSLTEKIHKDHDSVVRALQTELNEQKEIVRYLERTMNQNAENRAEVVRKSREEHDLFIERNKVSIMLCCRGTS